jgi:predicted HTH transcriptional regulator
MSLNKPIDSITESDLQSLIDNQTAEQKTLEYKQALPVGTMESRREFLADVSSMANAAGGHLLFGIEERAGMPQNLGGVHVDDIDALKLRLEGMLRDGISPRLPRVEIHPVPLVAKPGYFVLLLRIQKSWLQPHRVIFNDHGHFYSRNSAGKYRLDVP